MYSLRTYMNIIVNSEEEIKAEIGALDSQFYERFVSAFLQ